MMNFAKGTIRGSPYIGVFCTATEDVALVPHSTEPKELRTVEHELEVEAIKTSLGNSSLLGALSRGMGRKVAVSVIAERHEVKQLEACGLEVLVLKGYESTGNLIALNKNAGMASILISEEETGELGKFFGIKFGRGRIAGSALVGACLTVTNKGLICHPSISDEEFTGILLRFGVHGKPTTANYGDVFVGNSVVANSKGALVGATTSGVEMMRIDDGLRGE